ncbi:MAG: glycosyltransferase [Planctomycetota bacterium]|nr:glycosyltransferase [Planctomycetota bacterium]
MRVLHYEPAIRLELGGVVRAVLDIATQQSRGNADVTLATHDATDVPPDFPGEVLVLPGPGPLGRLGPGVAKAKVVASQQDAIHLHGMWSLANIQWAELAKKANCPYFISPHGMLDNWCMDQKGLKKRLFLQLGGKKWLEQACGVHLTATAEQQQSRKWAPKMKSFVCPLPMDMAPFQDIPARDMAAQAEPAYAEDRPIVLFLSRLHEKKRPELLIDVARELQSEATIVLAGDGDPNYVESLRRQASDTTVRFPGFVRGTPKVAMYAHATCFALPTSQENFGYVLFEALAAGAPVLTTKGADTWPEIDTSGGGMVLDPTSKAFAAAIRQLIASPESTVQMGARGRTWALENLNAEAATKQLLNQYAQLKEEAG